MIFKSKFRQFITVDAKSENAVAYFAVGLSTSKLAVFKSKKGNLLLYFVSNAELASLDVFSPKQIAELFIDTWPLSNAPVSLIFNEVLPVMFGTLAIPDFSDKPEEGVFFDELALNAVLDEIKK